MSTRMKYISSILLILVIAIAIILVANSNSDDALASYGDSDGAAYISAPTGDMGVNYGDDTARVVIEEYASLSCSHCSRFYETIFQDIKDEYIDTGRVYFKYYHFPLNLPAFKAAQLVECQSSNRAKQKYLKTLFKTQKDWAHQHNEVEFNKKLRTIAKIGGMDLTSFNECMDNKSMETRLLEDSQRFSKTKDIKATPTLIINGKKYEGGKDFASISKYIDALLANE